MLTINLSQSDSIAGDYLADLRNKVVQNDRFRFRHNLKRMGQLMAFEASKKLTYVSQEIETPLGMANTRQLDEQPVIIAIMRAALPFFEGVLSVFDKADSGFVGAYRANDFQESKSINTEYIATNSLAERTVILVDPMLATGKSMIDAIKKLEDFGKPKKWIIFSVIAAPEGIEYLEKNLPESTQLWCGVIDEGLNKKSYIVPGLGDAGDLAYGEKM